MPPINEDEDLAPPAQYYVSEWKPQDGPRFRLADLISRGARKVGDFLAEKPPGIGYTPGDLANDMVVRPLQRTAERVAHGENPFFTGRGQTIRLRDDMVDTVLNAAPFAGNAVKAASRVGRALDKAIPMEAGKLYSGIPMPTTKRLRGDIPMSEALDPQKTTLRTLENLPDKARIQTSTIRQQLSRPEVTKSEKDVMEKVLSDIGEDSVSANTLVKKVAKETEKFGLAAKDSDEYADYGLDRIGRAADESHLWMPEDVSPAEEAAAVAAHAETLKNVPQNIRTTEWELPVSHGDTGNHFGNPKYFGHTRAFEQDGIPHVVEIQSDLAQKGPNFKPLSAEERSGLEGQLREAMWRRSEAENRLNETRKSWEGMAVPDLLASSARRYQETSELNSVMRQSEVRIAELESKLNASQASSSVNPMLKNWDRRLIREELSRAANRLEQSTSLGKHLVESGSDVERGQQLLSKPKVVRFADADTVAAVEGWPKKPSYVDGRVVNSPGTRGIRHSGSSMGTSSDALRTGRVKVEDGVPMREYTPVDVSRRPIGESFWRAFDPSADEASLLSDGFRFSPEHQGIYDRYKKDVEKYLKQLGGTEYVDDKGHRWIEVPVKSSHKRTQLFNVGAGAGAAGAAGAAATNKEAPQGGL